MGLARPTGSLNRRHCSRVDAVVFRRPGSFRRRRQAQLCLQWVKTRTRRRRSRSATTCWRARSWRDATASRRRGCRCSLHGAATCSRHASCGTLNGRCCCLHFSLTTRSCCGMRSARVSRQSCVGSGMQACADLRLTCVPCAGHAASSSAGRRGEAAAKGPWRPRRAGGTLARCSCQATKLSDSHNCSSCLRSYARQGKSRRGGQTRCPGAN